MAGRGEHRRLHGRPLAVVIGFPVELPALDVQQASGHVEVVGNHYPLDTVQGAGYGGGDQRVYQSQRRCPDEQQEEHAQRDRAHRASSHNRADSATVQG